MIIVLARWYHWRSEINWRPYIWYHYYTSQLRLVNMHCFPFFRIASARIFWKICMQQMHRGMAVLPPHRVGEVVLVSSQRLVWGRGEVFKLHSWASNGNECSTLLVAKAPVQALVPIFSRIHECFIFASHLMLTSYLSMSNKDVYCKEIL